MCNWRKRTYQPSAKWSDHAVIRISRNLPNLVYRPYAGCIAVSTKGWERLFASGPGKDKADVLSVLNNPLFLVPTKGYGSISH